MLLTLKKSNETERVEIDGIRERLLFFHQKYGAFIENEKLNETCDEIKKTLTK